MNKIFLKIFDVMVLSFGDERECNVQFLTRRIQSKLWEKEGGKEGFGLRLTINIVHTHDLKWADNSE